MVGPAVVEATAARIAGAHAGDQPVAGPQVLGNRHADLFRLRRVVGIAINLGVCRLPVPGHLGVDLRERPVSPPQRKKRASSGPASWGSQIMRGFPCHENQRSRNRPGWYKSR